MDDLEKVQAQILDLKKKAEELILQKKPAVIEDIKTKITAYGISARELGFGGAAVSKTHSTNPLAGIPVPAKYKLHDLTWSGRGRQPKFVMDYIEQGGKLEDLEIK